MTRRRMQRVERFARLPEAVLASPGWTTLPHAARTVLTVLAAQYMALADGATANGHQRLTRVICARYGIDHSHALEMTAVLEGRGRIVRTHRPTYLTGGRYASTWALGWLPITHRDHALLGAAEPAPVGWRSWQPAPAEPGAVTTAICAQCRTGFRARRRHARYCSGRCRQAAMRTRDVFTAGCRRASDGLLPGGSGQV